MHIYLSTAGLAQRILKIRGEYEKRKGKSLESSSSYRLFTYFGAADVTTRSQQVALLEKIAAYAQAKGTDDIMTANVDASWPAKVHALKLLTGVSYVIHKQIKDACSIRRSSYGILDDLICESLDVKNGNDLDDNTKLLCLQSLLGTELSEINQVLTKKISEIEWEKIKAKASELLIECKPKSSTPIADFLEQTGQVIGDIFGVGFGFVIGRVIGQSGASSSAKAALTAAIGGTFIFFGPVTGTGVVAATVMARSIAEASIDISSGYMGALLFRQAGSLVVGKTFRGAGLLAGLLLNSTTEGCEAIYKALSNFLNLTGDESISRIGLNLSTGCFAYQNQKGETKNDLVSIDKNGKQLSFLDLLKNLELVYGDNANTSPTTQVLNIKDFSNKLDLSQLKGCTKEQEEAIRQFHANALKLINTPPDGTLVADKRDVPIPHQVEADTLSA